MQNDRRATFRYRNHTVSIPKVGKTMTLRDQVAEIKILFQRLREGCSFPENMFQKAIRNIAIEGIERSNNALALLLSLEGFVKVGKCPEWHDKKPGSVVFGKCSVCNDTYQIRTPLEFGDVPKILDEIIKMDGVTGQCCKEVIWKHLGYKITQKIKL
jgi:hypothetical protein